MSADRQNTAVLIMLFHANCKLHGMIAENEYRKICGESPAYVEEHFLKLGQEVQQEFRVIATNESSPRLPG